MTPSVLILRHKRKSRLGLVLRGAKPLFAVVSIGAKSGLVSRGAKSGLVYREAKSGLVART